MIDNAAIAIADASPLMLTPGIRCENGRLAPINDPDWIKFTDQMIAVARQDLQGVAVAQPGGRVGSDRRPRPTRAPPATRPIARCGRRGRALDPTDPSNKANRCMSR